MAVDMRLEGGVAYITIDDGKVNAISTSLLERLSSVFDDAVRCSSTIVFSGREGFFSAGFDLKEISSKDANANYLVRNCFEFLYKLYSCPVPTVAVCSGHAVGIGGFILLACDYRIGVGDQFTVCLPETAIGMPFPPALFQIVKNRVGLNWLERVMLFSSRLSAKESVEAGFIDELSSLTSFSSCMNKVVTDISKLSIEYYKVNKGILRQDALKIIAESLADKDKGYL